MDEEFSVGKYCLSVQNLYGPRQEEITPLKLPCCEFMAELDHFAQFLLNVVEHGASKVHYLSWNNAHVICL